MSKPFVNSASLTNSILVAKSYGNPGPDSYYTGKTIGILMPNTEGL